MMVKCENIECVWEISTITTLQTLPPWFYTKMYLNFWSDVTKPPLADSVSYTLATIDAPKTKCKLYTLSTCGNNEVDSCVK